MNRKTEPVCPWGRAECSMWWTHDGASGQRPLHEDRARRGAFLAGEGTLTFAELEKWAEEFGANPGSSPTGDPQESMMVATAG